MKFAAKTISFADGDETNSEDTVAEVTEFTSDGSVEIAFNDRNERCYLTFKLQDVISAVAGLKGNKP